MVVSAMIGGIVTYLGTQLAQNKSVKELVNGLTDKAADWLQKKLLNEDGTEKEALEMLKKDPEDKDRQELVAGLLRIAVKDQPEAEACLQEWYDAMKATKEGQTAISIYNSKNVNTGTITTNGGSVQIGDNA